MLSEPECANTGQDETGEVNAHDEAVVEEQVAAWEQVQERTESWRTEEQQQAAQPQEQDRARAFIATEAEQTGQ